LTSKAYRRAESQWLGLSRPYVIIFSTVTLDGRLASKEGYSRLSCEFDKVRQHRLRSEVDAVMVGGGTVRKDDPLLTVRLVKAERNPIRVIVSGSLDLSPDLKVFVTPPPTIVYSDSRACEAKRDLVETLRARGVEVVCLEGLTLTKVMEDLYSRGVRKVMVEGGGRLIWSLIKEGLYDEIRLTFSPTVFGSGVSLAEGEGFRGPEAPKLRLMEFKLCECGREIHAVYKREG
jgi:2,5-diamino-6-(5-phosphoribosylamino)pyrimidin-4(3H)-one reductase (EC 1.1.1.-)